jgi:hypothetical protein
MSPLQHHSHSEPYSGSPIASRLLDPHPGHSYIHLEPPHVLPHPSRPPGTISYLQRHPPLQPCPCRPPQNALRLFYAPEPFPELYGHQSAPHAVPGPPSGLHHALAISALPMLVPLGSLQPSESSPTLACSPIQTLLPGQCSDNPVKHSFSGFLTLHVLPGLLRPAHRLPLPRLRHTWLPMTIDDLLVDLEHTPVRPFGLGGPWPLLTTPPPGRFPHP